MTKRHFAALGVTCASLAVLGGSSVQAQSTSQVLFSNIGPSGTDVSTTNAWGLYTYNSVAQSFTVTGSDYTLDSFQLPLSNDAAASYPLVVQLTQSVNGIPGTLLETFAATLSAGPTTPSLYTFTDKFSLKLTKGSSYSVSLYDPNQTSAALGAWACSNTSTAGLALSSNEGKSWFAYNVLPAAGLIVRGTAVPAAVPEASSVVTLGIGLFILTIVGRLAGSRRRRATA